MKKENIFWGMLFICLLLILISPILPSFDNKGKTALEVKTKLFSSQPLSRYKINVSEGETETEKTLIVKYNNWLETSEAIYLKRKKGESIANEEIWNLQEVTDNFTVFAEKNEFNIRNSLKKEIMENIDKWGNIFDEFDHEPALTSIVKDQEEEQAVSVFDDEEIQCIQKDKDYFKSCSEVEKEYKEHPEYYVDVSLYAVGDSSYRYYITKKGEEYNFASESYGVHGLLREDVYMLLNEQRFVKRK